MKKKTSLLITGFVLSALGSFFAVNCSLIRKSPEYNIILIISDALRSDVLGCYGGDAHTPNIDWLAQHGVLFENAYSIAPCTQPSSLGMFTGNQSGVYELPLPKKSQISHKILAFYVADKEQLMTEKMREKKYDVLMDVENKIVFLPNCLQGFTPLRDTSQLKQAEIAFVRQRLGISKTSTHKSHLTTLEKNSFFDFLHYILTVPKNKKFYLMKWFLDPHYPYAPPDRILKKISIDPSKLSHPLKYYFNMSTKQKNALPEYEKYVFLKQLYKAEVEYVDERIGYIIEALKQRDFLDRTYVVFTADHGEMFGEHNRIGHVGTFFEQAVRVPLIIMGPGIRKGDRIETVVSHLDLTPTLKDLLDIKYEDTMTGKSYAPLLSGGKSEDRIVFFDNRSSNVVSDDKNEALLMNGYKLIINPQKKQDSIQLYYLRKDPGELDDLSKKYPSIVNDMVQKIVELRKLNKAKQQKNLVDLGKKAEIIKSKKEYVKKLRSLGYI